MQRICFLLQVRPDRLDEYRDRHRQVWSALTQALHETGWGNYSLFLASDGLLVGYLETEDFAAAQRAMAALDVNTRWQAAMADFFVDLNGARPDEGMSVLSEVFHLD